MTAPTREQIMRACFSDIIAPMEREIALWKGRCDNFMDQNVARDARDQETRSALAAEREKVEKLRSTLRDLCDAAPECPQIALRARRALDETGGRDG